MKLQSPIFHIRTVEGPQEDRLGVVHQLGVIIVANQAHLFLLQRLIRAIAFFYYPFQCERVMVGLLCGQPLLIIQSECEEHFLKVRTIEIRIAVEPVIKLFPRPSS